MKAEEQEINPKLDLTDLGQCEIFITLHMPLVIKNTKCKLKFPFISNHARNIIIKSLAKSLNNHVLQHTPKQ